jgi:hypothetical protein
MCTSFLSSSSVFNGHTFHPPRQYVLSFLDVVHNIAFMNVLSEIHYHVMSPEEAIRHKLELKQQAHEAQRVFLRYVFHEVCPQNGFPNLMH